MSADQVVTAIANANRDKARTELVTIGRELFGGTREPSVEEIERLAHAALEYLGRARAADVIERRATGAKPN